MIIERNARKKHTLSEAAVQNSMSSSLPILTRYNIGFMQSHCMRMPLVSVKADLEASGSAREEEKYN